MIASLDVVTPTVKKFWHLVPSPSPRGYEAEGPLNGTTGGQHLPVSPVIGGILINAAGFFLDLGPHLGY